MTGYYVYQYLHPEYGHLYCGRTENLDKRIYDHNHSLNDNISREYEHILNESVVVYVELQNKSQEIAVEAYCIDKFKPFLNKSLKYDTKESLLEMKLPKWQIYNPEKSKKNARLNELQMELNTIEDDISNIEYEIKNKKLCLENDKFQLAKIEYETKSFHDMKNKNILFGFRIKDIRWYYEHCENKNVKFYSEIYDKIGNCVNRGVIYYDFENDGLILETNSKDSTLSTMNSNEAMFDIISNSYYNFYPDLEIYPELFAALMSKKDETLIKNKPYNIKDLIDKYDVPFFSSIDDSIRVQFKNGEIYSCNIRDDSLDNGFYAWTFGEGREVLNTNTHTIEYIKEDLDKKIIKHIFSSKYYSPESDVEEEKYCNNMLLKYAS